MLALGLSIKVLPPDASGSDWKSWLPVVFISIFVVCYAAGPGPLPYALIGECFASKQTIIDKSVLNYFLK